MTSFGPKRPLWAAARFTALACDGIAAWCWVNAPAGVIADRGGGFGTVIGVAHGDQAEDLLACGADVVASCRDALGAPPGACRLLRGIALEYNTRPRSPLRWIAGSCHVGSSTL